MTSLPEISLPEFMDAFNKRVYNLENVGEALWCALRTKQNVLLHGEGGFAKSLSAEVALTAVVNDFYQEVFITTFGSGMRVEQFLGVPDIPALQNGQYRTIMAHTLYVSKKYAILEELLSGPARVLLGLRDPLQRGYICADGVCVPNTLQNVFATTNVDPKEWVSSLPVEEAVGGSALLNRFQIQVKVEFPINRATIEGLLSHQFNVVDPLFVEMMELMTDVTNPRQIVRMWNTYQNVGVLGLRHMENVTPKIYSEMLQIEKKRVAYTTLQNLQQTFRSIPEVRNVQQQLQMLYNLQESILNVNLPEDGDLSDSFTVLFEQSQNMMTNLIKNSTNAIPGSSTYTIGEKIGRLSL